MELRSCPRDEQCNRERLQHLSDKQPGAVVGGDRTQLGELAIEVLDAERFRVRWVIVQTEPPPTEEVEESTNA